MKEFFRQVDKAVLGSLSALVFFVLGFLWWIFDFDSLVPMWVLSLTIIICYLVCVVVYAVCSSRKSSTVYRLPAVKTIHKSCDKVIFLVEKNELFNQGSYATICYQTDEESLETVLGLGYVQTINSAGLLQVEIEKLMQTEMAKELYEKIDNTPACRKAIKMKPSIYKELIQEV